MRRRWVAVGVLALVGFLCGFTLALKRRELAEQWLLVKLREAGVPAPSLFVGRLDWGVLEVRELRAGDGALEVAHVAARFGARGLLAGRLQALRVRGLEMKGSPDGIEPVTSAFGALLAGGSRADGVPWDALELAGARIVLHTALGEVEALGSGRLVRLGETGVEGEARVEVTRGLLRARTRVSGSGTPEALAGELTLELLASGPFASGSLEAASLTARADLRGRPEAWRLVLRECADVGVDGLVLRGTAVLASPLRACVGEPEQPLLAVATSAAGERNVEGALDLPATPLDLRLLGAKAAAESPRLSIRLLGAPGPRTLTVASRGGLLEVPDWGLEARGLEGALTWSPAAGLEGRMRVEEILDVSGAQRLPRLGLALEARRAGRETALSLRLSDDARLLVLDLAGRTPGAGRPLRAELRLEPVSLASDGVELLRLLPGLADVEASGSVAALGALTWGEGGLSGGVDLALRDVDVSSPLAQVELANGVVRLEGPSPFSSPPDQLVSAARLDFGLELLDGLVRFALGPDGLLTLEQSEWSLAGGRAVARGSLDPEAPIVLAVDEADPSELFALLDLPGLRGEGSLSGTITLARREQELVIESASFADPEGGFLRYEPAADEPAEVRAVLAPRAGALANFRYEDLLLELAGKVPGEVRVGVTLFGTNPDLGGASPVELRFDVPGVLEPRPGVTVRDAVVPPEVEEQLAAFDARLESWER